ncbi:MAG: SDR family NAD(P)-dependent oxidoreductase, partial [Aliihoeflea sp.]
NADLETFCRVLAGRNIDTARVPIDIAAHSRMLDGILAPFEAYLRSIVLRAPTIAIISNRDGQPLSAADATDPAYWVRHLRSTVEFAKGLAFLAADERRIFIEVGPGRTLSSLVKAQGNIDANRVINSLPHADDDQDDYLHFNAALGRSWAVGLAPDIEGLISRQGARRVGLPTYPFQHKRYFIEPSRDKGREASAEAPLEKIADMEQWGYRRSWKRSVPDYTPHAEASLSSWLIFLDDAGQGTKLATRLRGIGHTVATVAIGDVFAVRGADEFVLCPEDGRAGYDALVSALGERGDLPRRIVHLWLVTEGQTFRPGSSFLQRNQECGFHSLLHLAQALAEVDQGHDLEITIGTNGLQRVDREAVPYPEKATVLGPAMVIPREFADSSVRVVDFEIAPPPVQARRWKRQPVKIDAISNQLWEEIFSGAASEVVAWRGERRWTQSHTKLPLKQATPEIAGLRKDGVYLFTGGLADLSVTLARSMARDLHARLVLLGRTELPRRDAWPLWRRVLPRRHGIRRAIDAIESLEADGAEVLYLKADVTDLDAMERAFSQARERFGAIDGVFHAAGVVDDGLMAAKSTESIDNVLAPKLYGTAVLDQVLARDPVNLVVLFSSTSTDTAPAGQVDYIAANAYLNAYAEAHAGDRDRRTVAVHWGVWNEVGMAARAVAGASSLSAGVAISNVRPCDTLFDRWVEDENGVAWLEADMGPDKHWMLDEHRLTSGQAILPGTAYIDIFMRAARAYGLAATGVLSNLVFLRPLMVPDGETRTLRIVFTPAGDGFQATIHCAGKHAEALFMPGDLDMARGEPTARLDAICRDVRRAPEGSALASVQEGHIRFGPRWRVLRQLSLGPRVAIAKIALAPGFLGDIDAGCLVHPALLDIATGCAMELVPGYAPNDTLWAPASYGSFTLHKALPRQFDSIIRLADSADLGEGYAAFDVQIVDADGILIVEIA